MKLFKRWAAEWTEKIAAKIVSGIGVRDEPDLTGSKDLRKYAFSV